MSSLSSRCFEQLGPDVFSAFYLVIIYPLLNAKLKKALNLQITRCVLVDFSTVICWTSPFAILEMSGLFCRFYSILTENHVISKQCDPDQTPHYVASDLDLQFAFVPFMCFPVRMGLGRSR